MIPVSPGETLYWDIVYSNTVDTDFVNEYEDIEMKINTYTNNVPVSRSFVMCDNTNSYVTKHYNKATETTREMEYHIIEKILDHYIQMLLCQSPIVQSAEESWVKNNGNWIKRLLERNQGLLFKI